MTWRRTPDPDVIERGDFFIRRAKRPDGSTVYLLGRESGEGRNRNAECLGGFDSADEAKARAVE